MTGWVAAAVIAGIALPHLVDLRRAAPVTAIALWASSLALRALTAAFVVVYLVLFLPQTELFAAVTHWCWEAVLPLLSTRAGLDGHRVGDAAVILPSFLLAASALSVWVGIMRAARSVRRLLDHHAVGVGPQDSVIVGGPEVMLAAAGVIRPRIVVSAGALTALDDDELAAGLDHERGHIRHRHSVLLLSAHMCRAVGRLQPGGARALGQLDFHLERDADRFALRRNDRLALASVICKAAASHAPTVGSSSLAGHGLTERVRELMEEPGRSQPRLGSGLLGGAALLAVALTLALGALLPATVLAGGFHPLDADPPRHCGP